MACGEMVEKMKTKLVTYSELEWAMDFAGNEGLLDQRQKKVLAIYRGFHSANKHKMEPIPVCKIPSELKP